MMLTESPAVDLRDLEGELRRQWQVLQEPGAPPLLHAHMSNLVIFCDRAELAEEKTKDVPAIVAAHPARVLLLVGEPGTDGREVTARVRVWSHGAGGSGRIGSEHVTLRAHGQGVERLPFAVRELLIGDLPTNVWWASAVPPPRAGPLLEDLCESAQQLLYDSLGWIDPHHGVAATPSWLAQFERHAAGGDWRVASDLNWRRLKYWRRLLAQALDPASAPGALASVTEVLVEHGPHAVTQAWQLVGWLASRLGWQLQGACLQPGVQISWQVVASHGTFRLRIHRLPEGPAEVRRVRIACTLDGKAGALNLEVAGERRLAVVPEGLPVASRTVTLQRQPLADLVSRQLSDREPDPVFRESMAVAKVFAQSVLA